MSSAAHPYNQADLANTVIAEYHGLPRRQNEQVHWLSTLKKLENDLKPAWREDLTDLDDYFAYCHKFMNILERSESMWDEHLGSAKAVQLRFELRRTNVRLLHSAQKRGEQKTREIEEKYIGWMLAMYVFEPSQTNWELSIVSIPKMNGPIGFCVNYRSSNAVKIHNSYPIPCMDDWLTLLSMQRHSRHYTPTAVICKSKSQRRTRSRLQLRCLWT